MERIIIGDFVFILDTIIERKVIELKRQGKNNIARKWESYYRFSFEVIGFDENNLVILRDANGNQIHISRRALTLNQE